MRLREAGLVQRRVGVALDAALRLPLGAAMSKENKAAGWEHQ